MKISIIQNKIDNFNFIDKDNEYYNKYIELIYSNLQTPKIKNKTQSHHIIPRYVYKFNNIKLDNSKNNRVNLFYKDHVLAHAYLLICSSTLLFKQFNYYALNKMFGIKGINVTEVLNTLQDLQYNYEVVKNSTINPMEDPEILKRHNETMNSLEVRNKISNTMKDYRLLTKHYINIFKGHDIKRIDPQYIDEWVENGWKMGTPKGKIRINNGKRESTVWKEDLPKYLSLGWVVGANPDRKKSIKKNPEIPNSTKGWTEEKRLAASERSKKQFSNINNRRHCSYRVGIDNDIQFIEFESCFECAEALGYSKTAIHSGVIGKNIKNGKVMYKKSPYYNWNIYRLPKESDVNE